MLPLSTRLLANHLGVSIKYLTWLAHELLGSSENFYTKTAIPKGGGKVRYVYVVDPRLVKLQKRLKLLLEDSLPPSGTSYAYEKGISIQDAAKRLDGHRVLVSIDIKNHFGSITMWQVTKMFEHHGADAQVAFLLARLCCITEGRRSFLPQGSVVSPMLSNRVCEWLLDPVLVEEFPDACITRYSDNIYLGYSSQINGRGTLNKLRGIISKTTKWRTHKGRIMPYYRRQRGLGLVVNVFPNMPRHKYDNLRALLHNLGTKDVSEVMAKAKSFGIEEEDAEELVTRIGYQLTYWRNFLAPGRYNKLMALHDAAKDNYERER